MPPSRRASAPDTSGLPLPALASPVSPIFGRSLSWLLRSPRLPKDFPPRSPSASVFHDRNSGDRYSTAATARKRAKSTPTSEVVASHEVFVISREQQRQLDLYRNQQQQQHQALPVRPVRSSSLTASKSATPVLPPVAEHSPLTTPDPLHLSFQDFAQGQPEIVSEIMQGGTMVGNAPFAETGGSSRMHTGGVAGSPASADPNAQFEVGMAYTTNEQTLAGPIPHAQQYWQGYESQQQPQQLDQQSQHQYMQQQQHQQQQRAQPLPSGAPAVFAANGHQPMSPNGHASRPQLQQASSSSLSSASSSMAAPAGRFALDEQQQQNRKGDASMPASRAGSRLMPSSRPSTSATTTPGHTQGGASSADDNTPQFSVEVIAPSFDKRGYPVFAGRAAAIRGVIRLKAMQGCEVEIKLGAFISQGAPAAVWDGIALMPPEQGADHKVFSIREILSLEDNMIRIRDEAATNAAAPGAEDYVFETPFEISMPLGVSTRIVNGETNVTAVSLPPSFEMSSQTQRDELSRASGLLKSGAASIRSRSSRLTALTNPSSLGATVRDAVERGLAEEYRVGCFYKLDFTLQRTAKTVAAAQPKKRLGKNKPAKPQVLDSISVPFIFLGEPSTMQPAPLSIPATLIANAVGQPGSFLDDGWECERISAKWPGALLKQMKRNIDLELHMPSPPVVHAPSLFPVLLVLRPHDPRLLSAVPADWVPGSPSHSDGAWTNAAGGAAGHSRQSSVSTQKPRIGGPTPEAKDNMDRSQDQETLLPTGQGESDPEGLLSRFMRSSLNLSRKKSAHTLNNSSSASIHSMPRFSSQIGFDDKERNPPTTAGGPGSVSGASSSSASFREAMATALSVRRPDTAPPSQSSSDGRSRVSGVTTLLGRHGEYRGNLSGLVRVSLVQTTFCVATGPSDTPMRMRQLISIAEVEELDSEQLRTMLRSPDGAEDEHEARLRQALEEQLQSRGTRVLRALFRVGSDVVPSFRCHGIEVKYGIKVDLVPFNTREHVTKRPSSRGTTNTEAASSSSAAPSIHARSSMDQGNSSSSNASQWPPTSPTATSHTAGNDSTYGGGRETPSVSTVRNANKHTGLGGGVSNGGGGGTVISTVYADRAHSYDKVEKGVGHLYANVRVVRGAT